MIFNWDFDAGSDGFAYQDDAFRSTSKAGYASGSWSGGGLTVRLGGRDGVDVARMSGGWTKSFTLDEDQSVSLTLVFRLTQTGAYEANEYSEALVALDGSILKVEDRDYLGRIAGDGGGGPDRSTGWRSVTIDLGELTAGRHDLSFGGYNNLKTESTESTTIQFDDIVVTGIAAPDDNDGGGGGAPTSLEAFEARVFELTNAFRVKNGRDPFNNDARLNAAAEDWSQDMARGDFFRHSTTAQVEAEGYKWRSWGENIAAGQSTPEAVVNGWINSPGHRANMLRDSYEDIGVGYAYLPDDAGSLRYKHYWTQVFGTEADSIA